jgi:tyrosinase
MYTRQNVWELGGPWADPILWYARGVAAMQARALALPTAWRFYAAIHGLDQGLWQQLGYLSPGEQMPSQPLQTQFWLQCQHGSWFFLPWHRGYLLAFEANIRAAVVQLGGPADWALPYWNYFKPNENALPPAFGSPDWPDGKGNNPLYVPQRYGPNNDGNVYVDLSQVNLDAMNDPDFSGIPNGDRGFGGIDTGFEHGGQYHGQLEMQPHDQVHGLVGGQDPSSGLPGLMSDPDTAGIDPIFYLHHANIDRLWQVWNQNPPTNVDPTDSKWLNGPASIGQRAFSMPMPDGTSWNYTPTQMVNMSALGYTYDDLSPAVPAAQPAQRLLALGAAAAAVNVRLGAKPVPTPTNVELVGASQAPLTIKGSQVSTSVKLDQNVRRKVSASLAAAATAETATPDRVFLNLENIRGTKDATRFKVYVSLPQGANPEHYPELLAGDVSLFGVRKASLKDGEHAGQGLTHVLEISDIVDKLHLRNQLDADSLDVRIVPNKPIPAGSQISVGRVSIFRQGA